MSNEICSVCGELNAGIVQTVKILDNDNRRSVMISGHVQCTEDVWQKVQEMKDFKNMRLETVVKKLKLDVSL